MSQFIANHIHTSNSNNIGDNPVSDLSFWTKSLNMKVFKAYLRTGKRLLDPRVTTIIFHKHYLNIP